VDVSAGADLAQQLAEPEAAAEADVRPDLTGPQPGRPDCRRDGVAVALVEGAAQETASKAFGPAELAGKSGTSAVA
jgi:hypothetical protein